MCETKRDETVNIEGVQLPNSRPPNLSSTVKFDIGDFVVSHRKIKRLCKPGVNLYKSFVYVTRWEYPGLSLACFVVFMYISLFKPVYFMLLLLGFTIGVLGLLGIRATGSKWTKHSIRRHVYKSIQLQETSDTSEQTLKKQAMLQAQDHLREYIKVLTEIQNTMDTLCWYLEVIYKLFKWENYRTSGVFLGVLITSALLIFCLSAGLIMALVVTAVFTLNEGFRDFCRWVFTVTNEKVKKMLQAAVIKMEKRRYSSSGFNMTDVNSYYSVIENGEEWYDAETEFSDSSETDDTDPFDPMGKPKNRRTRLLSMVSQFSDYRKRKKKMNSGNCASCNVSFSTILKKRQYCRHCGNSFCSRCCSQKVKRSVFGATAPAAFEQTVLVCRSCYGFLVPEDLMES